MFDPKEVKDLIKELLNAIGNPDEHNWGRAVFWIGAGCSHSAGIPLAGEIAQQCVKRLADKYSSGKVITDDPLEALKWLHENEWVDESWYSEGKPKWGQLYGPIFSKEFRSVTHQREIILDSISRGGGEINWAHLCLGELVKQRYIHTILTTNFDQLVLEGIIRTGILPVIADGMESLTRIDSIPKTPQVVHLHGSMHTYNMRNSTDAVLETAQHSALRGMLYALLRECSMLVVVGYAGGEEGVMNVLLEVAESLPDLVIYWTMYEGNPDSLSGKAHELLNLGHNKFVILNSDADTLFAQIMEELKIGIPRWMHDPTKTLIEQSQRFASSENEDIRIKIKDYQEKVQEVNNQWLATKARSINLQDKIAKIATLRLEGKHKEALDELLKLENVNDPEVWRMRAESSYELGQLPFNPELLQESVTSWKRVLKSILKEAHPNFWYEAQIGLGGALLSLSESNESDEQYLRSAISAFQTAFDDESRQAPPSDWNDAQEWADAQNKLGGALLKLGEVEDSTEYLKEAVAAHQAALKVYTRERAPDKWAETQAHLGEALGILGEREKDASHLKGAVAAYREALAVKTLKRAPLEWAELQDNLGWALQTLGVSEADVSILGEAVIAYQEALKEYPREKKWAATQFNLGGALNETYKLNNDISLLEKAEKAYQLALEFYRESEDMDPLQLVEEDLAELRKVLKERREKPEDQISD